MVKAQVHDNLTKQSERSGRPPYLRTERTPVSRPRPSRHTSGPGALVTRTKVPLDPSVGFPMNSQGFSMIPYDFLMNS